MKKLPLLSVLLLSWAACKEIPPTIGECQTERVVLVEEFTGVRCVNCPIGSEKIQQLIEQYGENKIIAVSIHSGFFSVPYPYSAEDFTTADGGDIDALLGPVTAYPAACINRKLYANESQRPLGVSSWAGYIAAELCAEPLVDVSLTTVFDTTSRRLTASVTVKKNDNTVFSDALGLTVLLTEDGVVSAQLDGHGVDTFYTHRHILRDVLTDYRGATIHNGGSTLADYSQAFQYTLPAGWRADKCHVVAYVHHKGANGKFDVLQAAQHHVIE